MKKIREIFGGFDSKIETHKSHSCCGGSSHSHHEDGNPHSKTLYQCSMKCEGNKTYNTPGNCPVCNMQLVPVG